MKATDVPVSPVSAVSASSPVSTESPFPAPFRSTPELVTAERYTSAAVALLERERLWPRVWLLACVARDVASPGDFVVFELGDERIIVARDKQGTLGAYHDLCLHRGQRLSPCARGNAQGFVCGYHGWRWGLDGRLELAPDASRFPHGIPEERRRLPKVHCDSWGGFVWIHLGAPEQSLHEWLGEVVPQLAPYRPEEFVVTGDATVEWPCNWKLALDAFSETYHINATHEHLLQIVNPLNSRYSYLGPHARLELEFGSPPRRLADHVLYEQLLDEHGLHLETLGYDFARARRELQAAWRRRAGERGVDLGGVTDAQLTDTNQYLLFPNIHYDFHGANRLTIFRYRPHHADPQRCYFDIFDLARPTMVPTAGPRPPHVVTSTEALPLTIRQDAELLVTLQQRMRSGAYPGHLLHEHEGRLLSMHRTIDEFLARSPT